MTQWVRSSQGWMRAGFCAAVMAVALLPPATAFAWDPGSGGGGGGSGSSGSSGSGSGSSGSGSWDSGSSESGSWGSSGSGSGSSGSSSGYSGSGDTLSEYDSDSSGSDSSGSGSGFSGSSGSSDDGDGSSNSGSGSSDSGSDSSGSGHGSSSGDDRGGSRSHDYWGSLAVRERPEFDLAGFPVRRSEILVLDPSPALVRNLEERGFKVIRRDALRGLGSVLVHLRPPAGISAPAAAAMLNKGEPGGLFEVDHFLGVTSGRVERGKGAPMADMKRPDKDRLWIGMIDTAVWTGATLRGTRVEARDFANSKGKPPFAHGTAVASILARQGAARLTTANIFSADRRPYSSASAVVQALNWMVERKVPVINISIAGPRNALVDRAIAAVRARGHLVVAAAGNEGPAAPPAYPAASSGALAVTAIDREGRIYADANRGPYIEISALGVGVGAEAPDGSLKPHSGTSFAAPFVSAALARCLRSPDPGKSVACVRSMEARARDLGLPGRDPVYGYGLLVP